MALTGGRRMTNELEKQFFNTFNLTKYKLVSKYNKLLTYGPFDTLEDTNTVAKGVMDCFTIEEVYPQITDRILLELICILTKRYDYADQNWLTKCDDTKELKVSVLRLLLLCTTSIIEKYKRQVQALFEEG